MLNVSYCIDITHDKHWESFLALMGDDGEYIAIVRMQKLLIEKWNGIKHSQVNIFLIIGYNL